MSADIQSRLVWPAGRQRTPAHQRKNARFQLTIAAALDDLTDELRKMGARYVTVSSDVDGYERNGTWRPYASAPKPTDPGVAVYFDLDGEQLCMSCDHWTRVEDNVRAIGKTIEALRGIKRWGSSETMKQAFSGFRAALPAAGDDWQSVLGLNGDVSPESLKARYRELAAKAHPDRGGSVHEMTRLNQAMDNAKRELGI